MSKTKIALLGAGFIADIHIESYHRFVPEAEVVAVFTRDPKRARAFAKKHGIAQSLKGLNAAIPGAEARGRTIPSAAARLPSLVPCLA